MWVLNISRPTTPKFTPQGIDTLSGRALTRNNFGKRSARAAAWPSLSTSSDSPAPAVTTGTIGTWCSCARRANPEP